MPTVEALPRQLEREGARILAEALVDDPGWRAVGPGSRRRRRRMLVGHERGVLALCRRLGGPVLGASVEGRLTGVFVCVGPGRYPPPAWALAFEARGIVPAGPATVIRSLRGQAVMQRAHPKEPHVYVWMLGVDPECQRSGSGRALLARVAEHAARLEVPVYLETSNPDNLPYYRSNGYEVVGDDALPRGERIWFLRAYPR